MQVTDEFRSDRRGSLISTEGIPGVGKTYLTNRAVDRFLHQKQVIMLDEFNERRNGRPGLGGELHEALRAASNHDYFVRGGTPVAEAFLWLAIKRDDFDRIQDSLLHGMTVIEGRSVDSTAACQAVLIHPTDTEAALEEAQLLLGMASRFRPLPDLTILVTDDPNAAIARAETRDRRSFSSDQRAFVHAVNLLYTELAHADPVRWRVLDRRYTNESEASEQIAEWISQTQPRSGETSGLLGLLSGYA